MIHSVFRTVSYGEYSRLWLLQYKYVYVMKE